jgi:putative RNA 2'-phosphotransferase
LAKPPTTLFHGTSFDKLGLILSSGLRPMQRQFVHLTTEPTLAHSVGARHGKAHVLIVEAARAHAAGIEFFKANERFWLAKSVPAEYLRRPVDEY